MNTLYINFIADRLGLKSWRIENCIQLLEEGATVPFISRYRKEATGSMTDVEVAETNFLCQKFQELDKRKEAVIKSITEQEKMTEELRKAIDECVEMQKLEDLYLPFRPKRRTRASVAKENGLEPLAEKMLSLHFPDMMKVAESFVNEKVPDVEAALAGARDIIAEQISEKAEIREELRSYYGRSGILETKVVKGKEEEGENYSNYFNFSSPISKMPSHRVLAILRAVDEKVLSVKVSVDDAVALKIISRNFYKGKKFPQRELFSQIELAEEDAYKRLLDPSIENETLKVAKEKADLEAVKVFGDNLRQLLLAPPVGQKRTLAIDPGFRTGCKVVCLDAQGTLLHHDVIMPHPPINQKMEAMRKITEMVEKYNIEVIAIGNGTASRETDAFIRRLTFNHPVKIYSVSEDGASIYSASETAREEFPEYDVTVRGAVSIGRRLMDPLAELVKIDPKSLGVGQYQHDVDQTLLKEKLDDVVEMCVNTVGVDLNTGSPHLLSYVSGIGPATAKNIVSYRKDNGPFSSRKELLEVPRLGKKAYEQAAGFLRINGGENQLDSTAVHPERYALVEKMAKDMGCTVKDLIRNEERVNSIKLENYVGEDVGLPTLKDIAEELKKPGRDPREGVKEFAFSDQISTIEDLKEGMELPGIVTNLTAFGAFVDIGIKQNGLIHISNMSNRYIRSASEVLKLHQIVTVQVIGVDLKRQRIQLKLLK
ncbi:MAG: RNA-binding transcriptional accessory protein [Bacteroidales bacterium]|nr:RNA-binding transcriptional accessory protein [Bacteroidales bacterium]